MEESPVAARSQDPGYSALVTGCAVLAAPPRDRLEVTGDDRLRFVNGLVTCDVRELGPGGGAYGFFTSRQGRILSDAVISATAEGLALSLPPGRGEVIAAHMRQFRVADRVEIEAAQAADEILVAGPLAEEVVAAALGQPLAAEKWGRVQDEAIEVLREEWFGVVAGRVRGPGGEMTRLAEALEAAGAVRSGQAALEVVRVERGGPAWGVDFGDQNLPQETGLEDEAVSYSKGCYLGQEIVARIHYRGRASRTVCGVVAEGRASLAVGQEVFLDEQSVGQVTTSVWSPALEAAAGLAMLRSEAGPGMSASLPGGGAVRITGLPLIEAG